VHGEIPIFSGFTSFDGWMQANPITPPLNPHEIAFNHYSKPSLFMAKFQNLHGFISKPSFKPMEIPMKLQHVLYFSWFNSLSTTIFMVTFPMVSTPFNHQIPAMKHHETSIFQPSL
jgi:hypothetical protein